VRGSEVTVENIILYVLIGATAGVLSGLLGIGGGIIIVPALVLIIGLTQQEAQGTSLILLTAPLGLLAAWTYYQSGNADLRLAALLGVGFFFGAFVGARIATSLPNAVLQKIFGVALLLIAIWLLARK
jgi:hypothetical protein